MSATIQKTCDILRSCTSIKTNCHSRRSTWVRNPEDMPPVWCSEHSMQQTCYGRKANRTCNEKTLHRHHVTKVRIRSNCCTCRLASVPIQKRCHSRCATSGRSLKTSHPRSSSVMLWNNMNAPVNMGTYVYIHSLEGKELPVQNRSHVIPQETKQYQVTDQYRLTLSIFMQIRHWRVGVARQYISYESFPCVFLYKRRWDHTLQYKSYECDWGWIVFMESFFAPYHIHVHSYSLSYLYHILL